MSEVLTGKCTDAQIAALLVALHMKGETVEEIVGFAEAIRRSRRAASSRRRIGHRRKRHRARSSRRHLRHGWRCQQHLQHFDCNRVRRRGCRSPRRQAWQPQRDFKMRLCRRNGSSRREHHSHTSPRRRLPARSRHRLFVRACLALGDEIRPTGPARTAPAHRLQPARPAHQSGARFGASSRRLL